MAYDAGFLKLGMGENYALEDVFKKMKSCESSLRDSGVVVSVNGLESVSGWDILNSLRQWLESDNDSSSLRELSPQMLVVHTDDIVVRYGGVVNTGHGVFDLVQRRGDSIYYWYEISRSLRGVVRGRKSLEGFEMVVYPTTMSGELRVFVPCKKEDFDDLVRKFENSDFLNLKGMLIDASGDFRKQVNYFIIQDFEVINESYDLAEDVLSKLVSWKELIPMRHADTDESLFSEITMLSMMASAMAHRENWAVFNTIYFGPSQAGKTSVLKFLVCDLIGGSFESATASAGKGWLVSHKEGVESKMFSEKRAVLVDEMMKSVSTNAGNNHQSYTVAIKNLMQKHLQILDKTKVDASSGNGPVKGKMVCSFIGAENDDSILQKCMARAERSSPAAFARVQMGYVSRDINPLDDADVDPTYAVNKMKALFISRYGKNALKAIGALYMFSRKFTGSHKYDPPSWWTHQVRWDLYNRAKAGEFSKVFVPEMGVSYTSRDSMLKDLVKLQNKCYSMCWNVSQVFRGWEVHSTLESFEPVQDLKQQKMAQQLVDYFFSSKIRILEPGIEEALNKGVDRI